MPDPSTPEALRDWISSHPGVDLAALEARTQGRVSRRTLQRRLAELVAQGRVVSQRGWRTVTFHTADRGVGAAAAQLPGWRPAPMMRVAEPEAAYEPYVHLSPGSEDIKAYVRQPVERRKPVAYDLKFLEAYAPNATFYLPDTLRGQLHEMGRPPVEPAVAGTFARRVMDRLLIDLSWASSRLEGNTYSLLDTERLVAFGEIAEGKNSLETQMILNHKAAIQYLVEGEDAVGIDRQTILALHALLSDSLMPDPMTCGTLRQRRVGIGGSVFRPLAFPQSIDELFGIVLDMAAEIKDPFEQAFFLMVHLPYLQPFEDVNKRVSRLAANIPLIKANVCPLAFIDVPQRAYADAMLGVYELNRVELLRDVFVWAYGRSCQQYVEVRVEMVPPDPFRLRYRAALAEAVRAIVRGGLAVKKATVRKAVPRSVPPEAQAQFVEMMLKEFESIHASNAVRFGIGAMEFQAWKEGAGRGRR
ncbi:MAG: Fic family protein [Pseudomonadota bacterium]